MTTLQGECIDVKETGNIRVGCLYIDIRFNTTPWKGEVERSGNQSRGCVGTIIETATDTAIAIAKVPVKVGGAVVDVVTGEDEDDE